MLQRQIIAKPLQIAVAEARIRRRQRRLFCHLLYFSIPMDGSTGLRQSRWQVTGIHVGFSRTKMKRYW
jgi:hypothetical protein